MKRIFVLIAILGISLGIQLTAGDDAKDKKKKSDVNPKAVTVSMDVEIKGQIVKEEKELTRWSDEVARRRQELPWVRVDKDYRFNTDEGNATLADLFRECSQLLVYHFMFGPDYKAGCPSCSAIAAMISCTIVLPE